MRRRKRRAAERELRQLLREATEPERPGADEQADLELAAELDALFGNALSFHPAPWPLPGSPEARAQEQEEEEERRWAELEASWEANDWEEGD